MCVCVLRAWMGTRLEKKTIQCFSKVSKEYSTAMNSTSPASYVCVLLGAVELPEASGVVKKRRVDASNGKAGNTVKQIMAC